MKSLVLLLSLIGVTSIQAGIDFTPTTSERELAGIKFKQLRFNHNGRVVTYEQPKGWKYSGGGNSLKLNPPDPLRADAEIDQSRLEVPQNLDEETIKALREQVLASVPKDSQNVTVVSEEKNPFRINNHETYAVTISYVAFGQEFQRWVLFMNLPDTQVRFRFTARKAEFEKAQKAFRGSLFSWKWI